MENIAVIILIGIIGLLIVLFFVFVPVGLWISSLAANVKISIFNLIGMRLRRVVPSRIVLPLIKARKAGMKLGVNQLEAHYLAGGNVDNVVNALIASEKAGAAISYGLGQGATLVSALWGILIWKEFKGAPRISVRLNTGMFIFFLIGLGLLIYAGA